MPLTFEALKGQRFRWCFGGIQILRRHWRLMLPGRASTANRMDQGQRWAYLSGAVQWYGDLLAVMFFLFLLLGAGERRPRRRPALPQAQRLPPGRDPAAGRARPGASRGPPPARHGRLLARRPRRLHDLAVHVDRGRPRLGPGAVRQAGGVPPHPEDGRGRALVGRRSRQPAGVALRGARAGRHRRLPRGSDHRRPHHRRPARLAHRRVRLGAAQQPGRPARGASRRAQRAPAYGVPTLRCPTRDHHRSRADGRGRDRRRRRRPARPGRQAGGLAQPARPRPVGTIPRRRRRARLGRAARARRRPRPRPRRRPRRARRARPPRRPPRRRRRRRPPRPRRRPRRARHPRPPRPLPPPPERQPMCSGSSPSRSGSSGRKR